MVLLLLAGAAMGATWTPSQPLHAVQEREGYLVVPAGVAVELQPARGAELPEVWTLATVRDPETAELVAVEGPAWKADIRGVAHGLLVVANAEPRLLHVVPHGGPVRVRTTTRRAELAAWLKVQSMLDRADRVSEQALPWGSEAVAASVRLRAQAVADRQVRALGTAADLGPLVPLHQTTHARSSEVEALLAPDEPWTQQIQGPGTLVLSLRPRTQGAWARAELELELDGQALALDPLVGTGAAFRIEELFVGPGAHTLTLKVPGVAVQARLRLAQIRQPLLGTRLRPIPQTVTELAATDPVGGAELAWLRHDREAALAGFRPLLDQPGPVGELARARILRLSHDPYELLRLSQLPPELSADGRRLCTDAILDRAAALPPDVVAQAVLATPEPDAAKVGAWLDELDGQRSRGIALIRAAEPLVDDGQELFSAEVRQRTVHSRFTRLDPDPLPEEAAEPPAAEPPAGAVISGTIFTDIGPGIPRVRVGAGEEQALWLPEWGARSPVLRLRAPGGGHLTVDDVPWTLGEEEVDVALAAGQHHLAVQAGPVYLLDPEVAPGGHPAFERQLDLLPRSWTLPDPGARVDLRMAVQPPVPLRLRFDDGTIRDVVPDAEGVVQVTAGTWATAVTVLPREPEVPVAVTLELRVRLDTAAAEPPEPVTDVEAALSELADLSRAIDLGNTSARLDRARLLGRMGLLTAARRDLRALLEGPDPALQREAHSLAGNLAPITPSAPAPGPTTAPSALALLDDPRTLPPGPPEQRAQALEAAAQDHDGDPALWAAAAEAWAQASALPQAWADLDRAGPLGDDLRDTLAAHTEWTRLAFPSGGEGLVRVPRPAEGPRVSADAPTWRRARDAMLAPPWAPGDESLLRGDLAMVVQAGAGDLVLDLFCRDERGSGSPCTVPLRIDAVHTELQIADGQVQTVHLPAERKPRDVEIGGPGADHALVLRTRLDETPLSGAVDMTAHRASPTRPLVYDVGGPALLRVESLRGKARIRVDGVDRARVTVDGPPAVVPLAEAGTHRVEIVGDADLQTSAGLLRPTVQGDQGAPEDALADLLLPSPSAFPVDVDKIFAHLGGPALPTLRRPARGGSVQVGLSAHLERLAVPDQAWQAAQLSGRYLFATPRSWSQVGAWARGPDSAAGALAELGRQGRLGFLGLSVDGALAPQPGVTVGHLGATLHGRLEPSLGRTLDLRLLAALRAATLSAPPSQPVDPHVWTTWAGDHPVYLQAEGDLVGSPTRDLRWRLGLRATSNTGPSLDRLGPTAAADLLLPQGTVLAVSGRVELRLADDHRDRSSVGGQVLLTAEQGMWEHQRRWWTPWAQLGWRVQPDGPLAAVGLEVLFSPQRGLNDLPPGSIAFRALRDLP